MSYTAPLDEKIEAPQPKPPQDLFKSLVIQIPLIFFFAMGHLLGFPSLIVSSGAIGVLLIVEMLTSKPSSHFAWLRWVAVLLGLLFVVNALVNILFVHDPRAIYNPIFYKKNIFCWASFLLYQSIWTLQPHSNAHTTRRPIGRFLIGLGLICFSLLCCRTALYIYWGDFYFEGYVLYLLVFIGSILAFLLLIPRLLPQKYKPNLVDDLTWLRFPQLLYIFIVLLFQRFSYLF